MIKQHSRRWLAPAVALSAGALAPSLGYPAQVVDGWSVQKATDAAADQAAHFKALADRKATDELANALERLPQTTQKGSIAYEWLLDRGLHELGRLKPTPAARSLVESTAQSQPQIYVRIDPDHGPRTAPLYDPGATARFVLKRWTRDAARDEAAAMLAVNGEPLLARFAQNDAPAELDPAKAGIVDAFERAPVQRLLPIREAMAAALRRGERVDELAAVAAARLRDRELFALVLAHSDPAVALKSMGEATVLSPDERLDVLAAGAERPEIASAAILQIGRLAASNARARAHLFDALDDPGSGASAATALATLQDDAVAAELGGRLLSESRESTRRTLALALQLDGSPAARAQLARFVDTRAGSASLRTEVSAWLAH